MDKNEEMGDMRERRIRGERRKEKETRETKTRV